jgi:predicted amidophosphoribosyltransferase
MNQKNNRKKDRKICLKCERKFTPTPTNPWLCDTCYKNNSHVDEKLATPISPVLHESEKIVSFK